MGARILVVDDNGAVVETLINVLSKQGYDVESCENGENGWERLGAGADGDAPELDLLLLDLNMPGIDGLTLLERVRRDERFAGLPVVMITANNDLDTRLRLLEAGADDYFAKPFDLVELLTCVEMLLSWRATEHLQWWRME